MSQGIVIGATSASNQWLDYLLDSMHTAYPVTIVVDWEMNAIKQCLYDEFVFLPQSTEVLDETLFDTVFNQYKGRSVSLTNTPCTFGMYLGKYRSELLRRMTFPEVTHKGAAVRAEGQWREPYIAQETTYVRLCDMPEGEVFVERCGRLNMVTESKYLRRWKGSWQWNPEWM